MAKKSSKGTSQIQNCTCEHVERKIMFMLQTTARCQPVCLQDANQSVCRMLTKGENCWESDVTLYLLILSVLTEL